ncbi:GntR family transcriptional regulator [bacterium]|nr:MAG: GntR family transcriptional regulator [bacterium]
MIEADKKPLRHREVESDIRRKVADAVWTVGDMLPGRRELAKQYNVSGVTMERAIDALVREGVLRSDGRRGTFVAAKVSIRSNTKVPASLKVGIVGTLYPIRHDLLDENNQWVRQVIQAVEHELSGENHETVFTNRALPDGSSNSLSRAILENIQEGVNCIVVLAHAQSPQDIEEAAAEAERSKIPTVFVTSTELSRPVPHVSPDGFDAGYQAGQHLLNLGMEEITFFSPFRAWWTEQRFSGLLTACRNAGLPPESVVAVPAEADEWQIEQDPESQGYEAAKLAFAAGQIKSAVVCANDGAAFGLLAAAKEAGRIVGQNLFVVSFDDTPDARGHRLTSLRAPWDAMGREAARLLMNEIDHKNDSLQIRLRWRLIPRGSSRRADAPPEQ